MSGMRSISFLCLPLAPTHITARTTQANSSFLASTGMGHGAWGLGRWSAGDKGTGPLGYESVSSGGGGGIPGGFFFGFSWALPADERQAQAQARHNRRQGTTAGMAPAHFDREGPVECWTFPPVARGPRVLMHVDAHRHYSRFGSALSLSTFLAD